MSGNLFTDDNPETTLEGLGFSTAEKTLASIDKIETYFDSLAKEQPVMAWTSPKTRPRRFLRTPQEISRYYSQQKMYRVLGLLNRAKTVFRKTGKPEMAVSIQILEQWMINYKRQK